MGKSKKKTQVEKVEIKNTVKKLSEDCIKCKHQCQKGLKYIKLVESGKQGKGVVCKC